MIGRKPVSPRVNTSQKATIANRKLAIGPATTTAPSGPYFGLEGGDTPQVLLPGFISTTLYDLNGTFPPDGREFFFTAGGGETIVHTRLQADGSWSAPEIAPFSGRYEEFDPLFSPDGPVHLIRP